jgi:adenylate cyclase
MLFCERIGMRAEEITRELINSGRLNSDDQNNVKKLFSEYQKVIRRSDKIIRKSERFSTELDKQRKQFEVLSDRLSRYLSPQIYEMIFSEGDTKITSKRKKLTIFFSDIRDFTSTTESLESEELTNLLNDYLTQMSEIALKYGATIDKYIGDAIVIFFGDPQSDGYREDAKKCIRMALEMRERMVEIEKKYVDEGIIDSFQIRIGINTGYVTVGNFGSDRRMDYTIIGGNVNLAARLETAAEPTTILISHETYSLVKDIVDVVKQSPISVKGISKELQTYKIIGLKNRNSVDELETVVDSLNKLGEKDDIIHKLEQIIEELKEG